MPISNPEIWSVAPGYGADVQEEVKITYEGLTNQVTYEQLFPLITQQNIAAGGLPPQRIGFNTLFKMLFDQVFFLQRGGFYQWDETVQYDSGAIVLHNNQPYISLADSNTGHDPATSADFWSDRIGNSIALEYVALLPADAQAKENTFYVVPTE